MVTVIGGNGAIPVGFASLFHGGSENPVYFGTDQLGRVRNDFVICHSFTGLRSCQVRNFLAHKNRPDLPTILFSKFKISHPLQYTF